MFHLPLAFGALALTVACVGSDDTQDTLVDSKPDAERTCAQVEADFAAETASVRACEQDSDCGQVLTGTSCGCTRNWVANTSADTTAFYALIDESNEMGCELPLGSTCDCPQDYGFECAEGTCQYDLSPPEALPSCADETSLAFTQGTASITGDTLTVPLEYSGGCHDHSFELCWPDQSFKESSPVQAALVVYDLSEADPCEAMISVAPTFDLSPLKASYQQQYSASGEIRVRVGDQSLSYAF